MSLWGAKFYFSTLFLNLKSLVVSLIEDEFAAKGLFHHHYFLLFGNMHLYVRYNIEKKRL